MNGSRGSPAQNHEFAEVAPSGGPLAEPLPIESLKNVRLAVTADLGQAGLSVREILELKQGSVVPLDKLAGEMTDIYVNEIPLAKGEVVVIADVLHVRVAEVLGVTHEDKDLAEGEE